jgi:hypothetical protein
LGPELLCDVIAVPRYRSVPQGLGEARVRGFFTAIKSALTRLPPPEPGPLRSGRLSCRPSSGKDIFSCKIAKAICARAIKLRPVVFLAAPP